MAHRKNVKRIDPRYFLHETVNRGEKELEERMPGVPKDVQQHRDIGGRGLGGKKAQKSAQDQRAQEMAAEAADAADVGGQQWDYLYGMYLDQIRNSMGLRESDENIEEAEEVLQEEPPPGLATTAATAERVKGELPPEAAKWADAYLDKRPEVEERQAKLTRSPNAYKINSLTHDAVAKMFPDYGKIFHAAQYRKGTEEGEKAADSLKLFQQAIASRADERKAAAAEKLKIQQRDAASRRAADRRYGREDW